jgi:prephenate dehydrogenase
MAGKETSGPENAVPTLFKNAWYFIVPGASATEDAVREVVTIAESVGAKPHRVGPEQHDSFMAPISHLPLVVSSALMACVSRSGTWHEIAKLAAGGFESTTRLASGDPVMNRDICTTNAREIVSWIDRYIAELQALRQYLADGNEQAVAKFFLDVYEQRKPWMVGTVPGPGSGSKVELPGTMERGAVGGAK